MSTSAERHAWIEKVHATLRVHFADCWYTVPDNVRVSVGIPKGLHGSKKAIGQCWSDTASKDSWFEIFVSPELDKSNDVIETIAHELVHATVGNEHGHKGEFKNCALAVGFKMPMTTTPADDKMIAFMAGLVQTIGEYPAGGLNINRRKKQATYLIKCECEMCGYPVRVTKKWIDAVGAPICPVDQTAMVCE